MPTVGDTIVISTVTNSYPQITHNRLSIASRPYKWAVPVERYRMPAGIIRDSPLSLIISISNNTTKARAANTQPDSTHLNPCSPTSFCPGHLIVKGNSDIRYIPWKCWARSSQVKLNITPTTISPIIVRTVRAMWVIIYILPETCCGI